MDTQSIARLLRISSDIQANGANGHGEPPPLGVPISPPHIGLPGADRSVGLEKIIIGQSPAMREIRSTIAKVADTKAAVILLGESGTEKELIAHTIHALSGVAEGPFVQVPMATISPNAMESQLFGDEQDPMAILDGQVSYFQRADGGTLYLDEIAELPLPIQTALLHFLQTGVIHPLGARQPREVDARVITATTCDPVGLVTQKKLSEELYFRLHVVPIHLPPLRERADDMGELAQSFLDRFAVRHNRAVQGLSEEAIDCLRSQWWPGNLRQLENVVERAVIFAREPLIRPDDLPREMLNFPESTGAAGGLRNGHRPSSDPPVLPQLKPIQKKERAAIIESLEQTDGHVVDAAELLGLSQATMYRKIKEYCIVRQRKRRKSKPN